MNSMKKYTWVSLILSGFQGARFDEDTVDRPGLAKFLYESASEEREHAIQMLTYLNSRGISFDESYDFGPSQLMVIVTKEHGCFLWSLFFSWYTRVPYGPSFFRSPSYEDIDVILRKNMKVFHGRSQQKILLVIICRHNNFKQNHSINIFPEIGESHQEIIRPLTKLPWTWK